jgi:MoaA/NifB/PqqE/SkfB family radical SAM enzyme
MRIWPIFLKRDNPDIAKVQSSAIPAPLAQPQIELQHVVIGTTGFCNASCIHCPTNKPETRHVARGTMTMPLFKRIADQLAARDITLTGPISFGLFGDSLMDPYVVERVRYLRKVLPNAFININTNGAAYSREKHLPLRESVSFVSLHIESLDAPTYNKLMTPLRLERVLPRCLALAEDFGQKLYVSVPISRANYLEKDTIESFF